MSIEGRATLFPLPVFARDEALRRWAVGALVLGLFLAVASISLAFPEGGKAGYGSRLSAGAAGGAAGQCVPFELDIQGFPAGYILQGDEFAAQGVDISVAARDGFPDNLIIFDSDTDEDLDDDLRVGIGNILILADNLTDVDPADGLVDKPDENNFGGVVTFTFDQPVTINSFIFVDHDHQAGDFAAAYDAAGNEIKKVFIPISGDGSVQTVQIDADGVSRFVLDYRDSGGFVPPEIECPPPGTPTPPVETPTPPVETGTATPPVETETPPVGTPTPPAQTPTPPIETGTSTPPVETATPPVETGTATPPVETETPPVETETPPVETETPPIETGTPTPTDTATPTAPGGESPTPTGTAVTGTQTPSPTATTVVSTATATPSPEAVLGAVTGPTGPGGVPTTGGVGDAGGTAAGKLLIVLGLLIGVTGIITALSNARKPA